MKLSSITGFLEAIVPLSLQENYDNSGLLFGNPDWDVERLLITLDLTPEVMCEAVQKKCNLIISHHPFIFKGMKKLSTGNPDTQVIAHAAKNDVAIYAMHTNLDNLLNGNNALLIKKLGITDFRVLQPSHGTLRKLITFCPVGDAPKVRSALFASGVGKIGKYDMCSFSTDGVGSFRVSENVKPFVGEVNELHYEKETRIEVIYPAYSESNIIDSLINAHPYEEVAYDIYPMENVSPTSGAGVIGSFPEPVDTLEFLMNVKNLLDLKMVRHTLPPLPQLHKVALCGGSGSFLIAEAIRQKADVFLTSDIRYHEFFDAVGKLLLVDIGHFESEQVVKEWIHDALIENFLLLHA